jgi:uncharacterized protein (TIGR02145 family)
MKTKITLLILLTIASVMAFGQCPTLQLTFTAVDSTVWVQLDSIKVMNRTQGGDTVLYYPDTVLMLTFVGINEHPDRPDGLRVMQNYPNPVMDQTTVSIYIPEKDKVSLRITDVTGRQLITMERVLEQGYHSFRFIPGDSRYYFFSVIWRGTRQTIKILSAGNGTKGTCRLEYLGADDYNKTPLKRVRARTDFLFSIGDTLLYIGYINGLETGMLDDPEISDNYIFQFATYTPCAGTPTVEYEGQVYNTIQIFNQCWLKENLNVGVIIPGGEEQWDNGMIEKFCYNDKPDSCTKYGGLYQWDEMMQYTIIQGTQGICPPGWHIPTDGEWNVLEGVADSQYGIGDTEWDSYWEFRGYDAGKNLKTTNGWWNGGNGTDLFGFSGLPGGIRSWPGYFEGAYGMGDWWSSTKNSNTGAWDRYLGYSDPGVRRDFNSAYWIYGFSVRCLRDD